MAGTILERLSGKKLIIICLILFGFQILCFLLGGLIAPSPTSVQQILATTCFDQNHIFDAGPDQFLFLRPMEKSNCYTFDLNSMDEEELNAFSRQHNMHANDVIFVFQIPLPKDGFDLDMSRWFNSMLGLLMIDIEYKKHIEMTSKYIRIESKLGYRNKWDPPNKWKFMAHAVQDRLLNCHIDDEMKIDGYYYNCSTIPLFELGNVFHDYYLINLRLPTNISMGLNKGLGKVKDLWLVEIHQNGGFTRIWFSLKIIWFPIILAFTIWFWRRVLIKYQPGNKDTFTYKAQSHITNGHNDKNITNSESNPLFNKNGQQLHSTRNYVKNGISLLEYTILMLGISMTFLNIPIDVFTLWFNMPYMLFYSDIRQGLFYASLFIFWIIFCGEHLIDDVPRNHLSAYWHYLGGVGFGSVVLFIFEVCERGVELQDPFFNIWSTEAGNKLAVSILALSSLCLFVYIILLGSLVYRVFRNISRKRLMLPAMNKTIKLKYEGIIYRFKFLMGVTCVCAGMTISYFLISHVSENHWKWTDLDDDRAHKGILPNLQYTSAFYTGVYGMWNLYVLSILIFYAPSHKNKTDDFTEEQECINLTEQSAKTYDVRFSKVTSEIPESTSMMTLLRKENLD